MGSNKLIILQYMYVKGTRPLAEGAEFRVLQQRGNWLLVRVGAEREGWLPAEDVVVY